EPTPVRKKYLYVVRPLACIRYITLHGKQPPTSFDDVLEAIDWSAEERHALDRLMVQKRAADELGKQAADPLLTKSITRWLDEYETAAHKLTVNETPTQKLDELINLAILGE
ncbi:MAG: nucleotidyltransferase domain-containing protein, partial [Phycisphaeraceae bacterium]